MWYIYYYMKKIVRLTESDLTRIVKRIIQEGEYDDLIDLSQLEYNTKTDDKPFNDLLIKNNFEYLRNHNDMDIYLLKKNNYDVMVGVEHSYMDRFFLLIYIITKGGEKINYLEDLYGKRELTLFDNEKIKVTRLIKGAIEFGESKKMIKENHGDRFTTVSHYIDMIEDVLDNYDSIDCENINRKYERFYCENISEYSKEKIETVLEKFKEERAELMHNEFGGLFGG
jgi:hypothetical protein